MTHKTQHLLVNCIVAAFYARLILIHAPLVAAGHLIVGFFLVQESLLFTLFLMRRESYETTKHWPDWLVAIAGTLLPLTLGPGDVGAVSWGVPMQAIGTTISIYALCSLGDSIGVVPANRGIKTTGAYAIVRHPMYLGHWITLNGYLLTYPSLHNLVIGWLAVSCMFTRIHYEEMLLGEFYSYQRYVDRVRWKLIPGVY